VEVMMTIGWKDLGNAWLVEDPQMALGWPTSEADSINDPNRSQLRDYLHIQLALAGLAVPQGVGEQTAWREKPLAL
jgi:hypothetical protein